MPPGTDGAAPNILVASYRRKFKLVWSLMVGMAAVVVVGALILDKSDAGPLFAFAASVFLLLAGGLLITIWRSHISFEKDGMLISGPLKTIWRGYEDLTAVRRMEGRVVLTFADGARASVNQHMCGFAEVIALLELKAPMR